MTIRDFRKTSAKAVADDVLRAAIRKTTDVLLTRRLACASEYPGFDDLRNWGRARKLEVSGRLEELVGEFSRKVEAVGGVIHLARNAREATDAVMQIVLTHGVRTAVKSKSMTAEEVSLNDALFDEGVEVTETDLGEFIIQLAGEKPSHILAPAIHKNQAQVGRLFHGALGTNRDLDVEGLVAAARKALRQRFLTADMGITGANFAVAETGTLVLVTNEGNGRMTTTLPPLHVAIVGIDKIIPRRSDLPGFLTLLTRSASGQVISSYVTLVTGPRKPGEDEGPRELHVVLLDNGRSSLASGPFREILHCLHCGSCLNVCPVYRVVGGHTYQSVYPGPMGDIISPLLWGMDRYGHLPDACTLCGACAEACPVRIPLPDFHLKLRALNTDGRIGQNLVSATSAACAAGASLYQGLVQTVRLLMHRQDGALAARAAGVLMKAWSSCRDIPRPQEGTDFRTWWKEGRKDSP